MQHLAPLLAAYQSVPKCTVCQTEICCGWTGLNAALSGTQYDSKVASTLECNFDAILAQL